MCNELPVVTSGPSIYDRLRAAVDERGRLPEDVTLPDEPAESGGINWAAGARDGVLGHHTGGQQTDRAEEVAQVLLAACAEPTEANLRALYEQVAEDDTMSYVDDLIERLGSAQAQTAPVHAIGRWLAATATDRGAVKLGLALLGITGVSEDVGLVRTLGAHDEFTLYAAVALTNGLPEPESELWALATCVDGWGRIHCVERLRETTDPDIRSWLLREGFRNSVMYAYLAHLAATTGGLLDALRTGPVGRDLLTAAGEIIVALIEGGPAEDIDDYADAADAITLLVGHLTRDGQTLRDFAAISAIHEFLSRDTGWETRAENGWTEPLRAELNARCAALLADPRWPERITAGLASTDEIEFHLADQAARELGLDTFAVHVARIRADPYCSNWFSAWHQADPQRAEQLVDLARTLLPIDTIPGPPTDDLGFGPAWKAHTALDWTLQALRAHPGVGADLLLVGLRSPITRNRNQALNALSAWPRQDWPDGAEAIVAHLGESDPNERTRVFAAGLLSG